MRAGPDAGLPSIAELRATLCVPSRRGGIRSFARKGSQVAGQGSRIRRIVKEIRELPGISVLARPWVRGRFRAHRRGNAYFGVYASYADARADIPASLPADYDTDAAAGLYEDRLTTIETSDYPALFWLRQLIDAGERRIVDLGGHVGLSYYAFNRFIAYPADLRWQVHDVPAVMRRGAALATERDSARQLEFVDLAAVDGCDVLMAKGALQYLEYSLSDLLKRQQVLPRHLLVNLTPLHPTRASFTLQNIGVAVCPYRIGSLAEFVPEIEALGYRLIAHWEHSERRVEIPFHPEHSVQCYHGFCFALADPS